MPEFRIVLQERLDYEILAEADDVNAATEIAYQVYSVYKADNLEVIVLSAEEVVNAQETDPA